MAIVRLKDFPKFNQAMLCALYQELKNTPKDGQWREFKGKLKIKDRVYEICCNYMLDGMFLTLEKQAEIKDEKSRLILPARCTND